MCLRFRLGFYFCFYEDIYFDFDFDFDLDTDFYIDLSSFFEYDKLNLFLLLFLESNIDYFTDLEFVFYLLLVFLYELFPSFKISAGLI